MQLNYNDRYNCKGMIKILMKQICPPDLKTHKDI